MTYPEGYKVTILRQKAPKRNLRLSRPQKPRTRKAQRQYVPGNIPYMTTSRFN